ncbi:MAG: HIRAN domain-containing protein [Psychrosphaera sp.]|nr:HIRAN domain-containing protein [Psychrosphaera sp.]
MTEHKTAYLTWPAPRSGQQHVIGVLTEYDDRYTFDYTKGALSSEKFRAFFGMEDLHQTYVSVDLFPLFKNRILPPKRPEYPRFMKWMRLDNNQITPANILGRSEAIRQTDSLQMFNRFEIDENGAFEHLFFVHAVPKGLLDKVSKLTDKHKLSFNMGEQHYLDENAIGISTESAGVIGYLPRYLAYDLGEFLMQKNAIKVELEHFEADAQPRYKLMCKVSGTLNTEQIEAYKNKEEFQLISDSCLEVA